MLFYDYGIFNNPDRADDVVYSDRDAAELDREGNRSHFYHMYVRTAIRKCVVWRFV